MSATCPYPQKEIFTFLDRNAFFLRNLYMGTRLFISSLDDVTDWTPVALRARFNVRTVAEHLGCTIRELRLHCQRRYKMTQNNGSTTCAAAKPNASFASANTPSKTS
jgi:hypothetical protein